MVAKNEEKYTDPDLRERIKEEIKASEKGGKKGQWSARKSQLLTQEYEKQGGGYRGGKNQSQRDLERWTAEEWQTQEGDSRARKDAGETRRYLPKKAWENMSEEERRETEGKKREGSRKGEQYVSNTEEAREARRDSHAPPIKNYGDLNVRDIKGKIQGLSKDEIREVRDYEKRHGNRKTLVEYLDARI